MALSKPAAPAGGPLTSGALAPSDVLLLFPRLSEMLSAAQWDDGSARVTSSILLFVEGILWKACLNDRAVGRTLWATGSTPEALFTALEGMLASGQCDWRAAPKSAPPRR